MSVVFAKRLAVLFLALRFVFATPWHVGNAIRLSSGPVVQGHASKWKPSVSEYLGIPYAEPPVGPLRFAPPKRYIGSGTINASKFSASCPSNGVDLATDVTTAKGIAMAALAFRGDTYDEDCLSINVWTQPQIGEKAKAVLLWIYGGGFSLGTSASPTYNGARLAAEQDVVVVSMNYRVNILGFPGAPGLSDQNLGLLDQRLAVEWVRDNIDRFGGDPKRITLFGESAGGASIDLYTYAWTEDPIVNGFIPQSGTAQLSQFIEFIGGGKNRTSRWFRASQRAGCGGATNSTAEESLQCMRAKPLKDIMAAIKSEGGLTSGAGGLGDYGPMPDGKVVFEDYKARAASGQIIKRPMFVGSNSNEGSLFLIILGIKAPLDSPLYGLLSTGTFACPSDVTANARIENKIKTWRYLYAGDFPNQDIGEGAGAFHGSEIPLVFGSSQYQQMYYSEVTRQNISFPNTLEQEKLMKKMMKAWSTFAKDPDNGLERDLHYPLYNSKGTTLIRFGGFNSSDVTFVDPRIADNGCETIKSLTGLVGSGLTGLPTLGTFGGFKSPGKRRLKNTLQL